MTDVETGQAESVLVQTEAGDVELIATDGPATVEAHVYAQTEERADATRIRAVVSNEGRLEISIDWPGGERRDSESCDIVARLPRMDGVWVRTGAGEIEVEGMAGEMLVETGAGDIDLTVLRDIAGKGDIDLSTGHGDVTVTLPADFSMDVDIDLGVTKSAGSDPSIRSDFPLQIDESKDWDYSMGSPRRHIRASGKPGGGLHRLKIRATNGNIILRRAQS